MAIIKQYHKDTDTTYVYESTSYWDADKRQSRSKRKLIGKLDPETGEVIPTGGRGRKKKDPAVVSNDETVQKQEQMIRDLTDKLSQKNATIASLQKENRELQDALLKIQKLLDQGLQISASALK